MTKIGNEPPIRHLPVPLNPLPKTEYGHLHHYVLRLELDLIREGPLNARR